MSRFLPTALVAVATICLVGSIGSGGQPPAEPSRKLCTPGYLQLSDKRILGSDGWNGSRVLLIGCKERLRKISPPMKAEITTQLTGFFDRTGWTFWWAAKEREERLQVIRSTEGYRQGDYTDFLLYDPVSGEP